MRINRNRGKARKTHELRRIKKKGSKVSGMLRKNWSKEQQEKFEQRLELYKKRAEQGLPLFEED